MAPSEPAVIVVEARASEDLAADGADVHVTVEGSNFVMGSAALEKAREVAALVAELSAQGIGKEALALEGIRASVSSGILAKSSTATYQLRIRCALDTLPGVLGAVAAGKHVSLDRVAWRYPDQAGAEARCLAACARAARAKGEAIAAALGVAIAGVRRASERGLSFSEPERPERVLGGAMRARAAPAAAPDLGFAIGNTRRIEAHLVLELHVAPAPVTA